MKTACLFTLYLIATIFGIILKWLLLLFRYTSKQIFRTIKVVEQQQYRLLPQQQSIKDEKKETKKEIVVEIKKEKSSTLNASIVGSSKTTFMKELPILRVPEEKEVKPFKTEPLAIIVEEEEEPDLVDFDVENSPDFDYDDMPYFNSNDDEDDLDNPMNSTGVSFEELSQTIEVLSKEEPTSTEKEKAVQVLNTIEDTELFQFITINNSVYNNAKVLMAVFNSGETQSASDFNINQYIMK